MSETAAWLNVPERMVWRLVAERRIPFVKVGRYVDSDPKTSTAGETATYGRPWS